MSAASRPASLAEMRAALREAEEAGSLRKVAKEAGLSPAGLRAFIEGASDPQPGTLRKLRLWLVSYEQRRYQVTADAARSALNLLVDGLGTRRANSARRRMLDALRAVHKEAGTPVPEWLAELGDE